MNSIKEYFWLNLKQSKKNEWITHIWTFFTVWRILSFFSLKALFFRLKSKCLVIMISALIAYFNKNILFNVRVASDFARTASGRFRSDRFSMFSEKNFYPSS